MPNNSDAGAADEGAADEGAADEGAAVANYVLHGITPLSKIKKKSSDSDEGPADRNEPPEKRAKMGSRTNVKERTWVLQGRKLVKVRELMGKVYVDIREYYKKNGELSPGKKGISLTPDMWKKLLSLGDEINEAIRKRC